MSTKFQKRIEDFNCERCGTPVKGSGYTNHCPNCLWSKHVDINPGDRAAECGGMMEPIAFENRKGTYMATHRCVKCKIEKHNRLETNDNFDAAAKIVKDIAAKTKI
jgi:ribosomal protein L37AE/L43A